MFLFDRKVIAAVGAAAIASVALFATPAQAAGAGTAEVVSSTLRFTARNGDTNDLVISMRGRTVTLDDRVAVTAGRGCRAVDGDVTIVTCRIPQRSGRLSVRLGDGDDSLTDQTSIDMLADGGIGSDTILGGAGDDRISGGDGRDYLYGGVGDDRIAGDAGDDFLVGESLLDLGMGNQVPSGSNSALDVLDGGSGVLDYCVVMLSATSVNCEIVESGGTAGTPPTSPAPGVAATRARAGN
jgi:Ca2+-binding RTX toxin-like protein